MCVKEYLQKLSTYITEHPPDLHSEDADSILDALFWAYNETACADSQAIHQYNENLNRLLQCLPEDQMDSIIDNVNDLCWEHDRRGFINGFKIGMHLEQEIAR